MAGMGHLAAIPAILIRHNQMVPYVPEKFDFADVRPKEAEKLPILTLTLLFSETPPK
jgi:hypothetical protein